MRIKMPRDFAIHPTLWWALAGSVGLLCIILIWALTADYMAHAVPWLALPPLILATFMKWRNVVLVGLGCLALAAFLLFYLGQRSINETHQHIFDFLVIAMAITIGATLSHTRNLGNLHLGRVTRVATVAQGAILRPINHNIGSFSVAATYISARTGADIGGDLYEALDTSYGVRLIIGDARGKGLDAVRLSSTVLGTFRFVAFERSDLHYMVDGLNNAVSRNAAEEDFVTALILEERGGTLKMVNCGHPAPLLFRAGTIRQLNSASLVPPLGLGGAIETDTIRLAAGDRLLLYTDGLAEARRNGQFFPIEERAPSLIGHGSVNDALASVEAALLEWVGGDLGDDIAILLLEYRPSGLSVTASAYISGL